MNLPGRLRGSILPEVVACAPSKDYTIKIFIVMELSMHTQNHKEGDREGGRVAQETKEESNI